MSNKKIIFIFHKLNYLLTFFLFCLLSKQIKNECNKEISILKGGGGLSQYNHPKEKFKNGIRRLDFTEHEINNIIRIGDKNCKYVSFASYSNGDMIVETTSTSKRIFYGIKSNGRPFFNSFHKRNKTYFFSIKLKENYHDRPDSELFVARLINDDLEIKENLINIFDDKRNSEVSSYFNN